MEQWAYWLKQRFPGWFPALEGMVRPVTLIRFGARIRYARNRATLEGGIDGQAALIRPLCPADLDRLHAFLAEQPDGRLQYFRPHGFSRRSLRRVLASGVFLKYGLFIGDRLVAYALLKVAPTGSAFIGRLVCADYTDRGLGRFLSRYLYWQASLAGLRARATIHRCNLASWRSHAAVAKFEIVTKLANDYLLIEFLPGHPEAPFLKLSDDSD
ncbi:hypothetical protein [Thioalkalivibrio sp. ALE11]|uniref:hypothetical protein n=1 Tax=Thioalkalivibrio sp. ALE11 TaxID=1265494 RepID=UPI0003743408|nr:hypothetical protein [Thioalkalivibrio sp. ALE11]